MERTIQNILFVSYLLSFSATPFAEKSSFEMRFTVKVDGIGFASDVSPPWDPKVYGYEIDDLEKNIDGGTVVVGFEARHAIKTTVLSAEHTQRFVLKDQKINFVVHSPALSFFWSHESLPGEILDLELTCEVHDDASVEFIHLQTYKKEEANQAVVTTPGAAPPPRDTSTLDKMRVYHYLSQKWAIVGLRECPISPFSCIS